MFRLLEYLFSSNPDNIHEEGLEKIVKSIEKPKGITTHHLITLVDDVTPLTTLPNNVLTRIIEYLPQNDLTNLAMTNSQFGRELVLRKLSKRIIIKKYPTLRDGDDNQWYIDTNYTTISNNGGKNINIEDTSSLLAKLHQFEQYLAHEPLAQCEELIIHDGLPTNDSPLLESLFRIVCTLMGRNGGLKVLKIFEKPLRLKINEYLFHQLLSLNSNLTNIIVDSISDLNHLANFPKLRCLSLNIENDNLVDYNLLTDFNDTVVQTLLLLEELVIIDDEDASLRILKLLGDLLSAKQCGEKLTNLKSLKFNHYHGIHNYNSILRNFSIIVVEQLINLSQLTKLEMEINCDESHCECMGTFLTSLSRQLTNLTSVAILEKQYYNKHSPIYKHQVYEDWDLQAFSFLINLPNKQKITKLLIKNDPPIDGNIEDGLEGNYLRRRKLYETTLPRFPNLQQLVLPNLMSSICCYEQLVSDLLWNGCECLKCQQHLSLFDTYLMTHQYFDYKQTFDFKDMISPRLFGFFADVLASRIPFFANYSNRSPQKFVELVSATSPASSLNQFEMLDNITLMAPNAVRWDFHGFSKIVCRDFKNDGDDEFYSEELAQFVRDDDAKSDDCYYDDECFDILVQCVDHFFKGKYFDWLAKQQPELKNLQVVVLNGVYYRLEECNGRTLANCIYD